MRGGTGTVRQVTNGHLYLNNKLVTATSLKERILCQTSERIKTTWEDAKIGIKNGFTAAKNSVSDFIQNIDWKRVGIGAAKAVGAAIVLAVSAVAVVYSAGSVIPALSAIAGGSAGAASLFTLGTFTMGSARVFMGTSDLLEGGQDVAYGVINKTDARSWNVLRDSLFPDNPDTYYLLEAGATYGAGSGTYVMQNFLLGEQVQLEANMLKGTSNSTVHSLFGPVAEGRGGAYENALKNGSQEGLSEAEINGVLEADKAAHLATQEGKLIADLGNKLEYQFGNASGNEHNLDRTRGLLAEMKKLGFEDTAENRSYFQKYYNNVLNDSNNIIEIKEQSYMLNGRKITYDATYRQSFLMGRNGGAQITTVWDGNRLLSVFIRSGGETRYSGETRYTLQNGENI